MKSLLNVLPLLLLGACAGPAGVGGFDRPTTPEVLRAGCRLEQSTLDKVRFVKVDGQDCPSLEISDGLAIRPGQDLIITGISEIRPQGRLIHQGGLSVANSTVLGAGIATLESTGVSSFDEVRLVGLDLLELGTPGVPAERAEWQKVRVEGEGGHKPSVFLYGHAGDACRAGKDFPPLHYYFSDVTIAAASDDTVVLQNIFLTDDAIKLPSNVSPALSIHWLDFCLPKGGAFVLPRGFVHVFDAAEIRGHLTLEQGARLAFSSGGTLDIVGGSLIATASKEKSGSRTRTTIGGEAFGGLRVRGGGTLDLAMTDIKGGGITVGPGKATLDRVMLDKAPACPEDPCAPGRTDAAIVVQGSGHLIVTGDLVVKDPPGNGIQVSTNGATPGRVDLQGELKTSGLPPGGREVFTPDPTPRAWLFRIRPITRDLQLEKRLKEELERSFGEYETDCQRDPDGDVFYKEMLTLRGEPIPHRDSRGLVSAWTWKFLYLDHQITYFADEACDKPQRETLYKGVFVRFLEQSADNGSLHLNNWLDIAFGEIHWTLHEPGLVSEFNRVHQCNYADWEVGVPKKVTYRPCFKVLAPGEPPPHSGIAAGDNDEGLKPHEDKTLILLEDDVLYLGPRIEKRATGHEETRPTKIDKSVAYKRVQRS